MSPQEFLLIIYQSRKNHTNYKIQNLFLINKELNNLANQED